MNPMPSWKSSSNGPYNVAAKFVEGATQSYGAKLEPPTYDEINEIADIFQTLNGKSRLLTYSAGFYDRTAFVTIDQADYVNPTFVENLQRRLAQVNGQWRIVLQGATAEDCVTVYPSKVILHGNKKLDTVLQKIRSDLIQHKASTEGVVQWQIDYVAKLLPDRIRNFDLIGLFPPKIVAAFDRGPGKQNNYCVWLLEPGYPHQKKSWLPDYDLGDGYRGVNGFMTFDVTKEGKMVPFLEAGRQFVGAINGLAYDKTNLKDKLIFQHPTEGTVLEIPFDVRLVITM